MTKKRKKWAFYIISSIAFLIIACIISISSGSAKIPIDRIITAFIEGKGTPEYSILFDIRLPRIIIGFAIGGALSLAGVILQGMFRNPLVEPYTLGISGGAALGAALCIIFRLNRILPDIALPISGFLGSFFIILPVYFLNLKKGILRIHGLLLTGVMVSFISSSLVILILAVSKTEDIQGIIFWIMGSLEEPSWAMIWIVFIVSVACLVLSYIFCLDMNAMTLGEEEAIHLGIDVEKKKKLLFLITSLLTGASVSVTGLIGFVGLIVPHFIRMLVGYDHRVLLVTSFLAGAGFLILCDTIARTVIAPVELPVGVITGILGGSIFIYAVSRRAFHL